MGLYPSTTRSDRGGKFTWLSRAGTMKAVLFLSSNDRGCDQLHLFVDVIDIGNFDEDICAERMFMEIEFLYRELWTHASSKKIVSNAQYAEENSKIE